jgi:hypothetical protein
MPSLQQSTLSMIVGGGLRSIAASVPGLASIGQAWSEYEDYKTGERITELMNNLKTNSNHFKIRLTTLKIFTKRLATSFFITRSYC